MNEDFNKTNNNRPFPGSAGSDNRIPEPDLKNAQVIRLNFFNIAAAGCGIIALFSILTGIIPFFFGSLSIIFAILSKGKELKMNKLARSSVITSAFSMVMGGILTVITVITLMTNPNASKYLDEAFVTTYGVTFDEYVEGMEQYRETGEIPDFMMQMY